MTSTRRHGAPKAKNRSVLLDSAERILVEEGYAAVTSRNIATVAGLKHQLVHYYFRTMEELFVAMFRRRAEEELKRQARALASARPLHALFALYSNPGSATMTLEFAALSNHHKALRSEILKYSKLLRQAELDAMPELMRRYGIDAAEVPPAALVLGMASVSRILLLERAIGMADGHAEVLSYIRGQLARLDARESRTQTVP